MHEVALEDILELSRESEAFQRGRKIKSPVQLLRTVFLYCGMDNSLRVVAGTLTQLEERITDSSVYERLRNCERWVKLALPKMLGSDLELPSGLRFVLLDGSSVMAPGAKGIQYRLHIGMDVMSLEFTHIMITDKSKGESLRNFELGVGDVAIADRGYCHGGAIVETIESGAQVIIRLNAHNVRLYHRDGSALKLADELEGRVHDSLHTVAVLIGSAKSSERAPGWVHAYHLPPKEAEEARRLCRKRNTKKGGTPKQTTLFLAEWVMVFTSIEPQHLSPETILQLYRNRWQIELAIKRWKSLLDVDELRARQGSVLAEVWLYGKLLYALMIERRMRRQMGDEWGRLDRERGATWWRPWQMVRQQVHPIISGVMYWKDSWQECLGVLRERPRRRKLQVLPEQARLHLSRPKDVFQQPSGVPLAA